MRCRHLLYPSSRHLRRKSLEFFFLNVLDFLCTPVNLFHLKEHNLNIRNLFRYVVWLSSMLFVYRLYEFGAFLNAKLLLPFSAVEVNRREAYLFSKHLKILPRYLSFLITLPLKREVSRSDGGRDLPSLKKLLLYSRP